MTYRCPKCGETSERVPLEVPHPDTGEPMLALPACWFCGETMEPEADYLRRKAMAAAFARE